MDFQWPWFWFVLLSTKRNINVTVIRYRCSVAPFFENSVMTITIHFVTDCLLTNVREKNQGAEHNLDTLATNMSSAAIGMEDGFI